MIVPAAGVGATLDDAWGKPNAGVLFQTSCRVGLLLTVKPYIRFLPANVGLFAHRISVLSKKPLLLALSKVPCTKPPCGNILSICSTSLFFQPAIGSFTSRIKGLTALLVCLPPFDASSPVRGSQSPSLNSLSGVTPEWRSESIEGG